MRFDVTIVGGGPAGAVTSLLLKRQGAGVALVESGGARRRLEGLSPRVSAILESLGLSLEGCGAAVQRQVSWGTPGGNANREHLVDRQVFDRGLRRQAQAAGVTLVEARAVRVDRGRRRVVLSSGEELTAGLLVEARGRRTPAAPGRRRGPPAVALSGWSGRTSAPFAAVSARPDGWIWQAAAAGGPVWRQAVVAADALAAGRPVFETVWRRLFPGGEAPMPPAPLVRACELRLTAPELDPACLCVGDAAVAMDPLSGHGVFWALSSALAAQPLSRALLDGEPELARRFYRDRVAETFWRQARIGRDFHRLSGFEEPFWSARRDWPDSRPAQPSVDRPRLRPQVVVRDGRLAEAEVLVTRRDPGGVAFVLGHEIAPILRRIGAGPWPDRRAFCRRVLPDTAPDQAGAIHDWLLDRGLAAFDGFNHSIRTESAR